MDGRNGADALVVHRELQREKVWSRIHLVPLLLAEGDRDAFRRQQAALAREKEIMKDVPGWEVRDHLRGQMAVRADGTWLSLRGRGGCRRGRVCTTIPDTVRRTALWCSDRVERGVCCNLICLASELRVWRES